MTTFRCTACDHEVEVISVHAQCWHGSCRKAKRPPMLAVTPETVKP